MVMSNWILCGIWYPFSPNAYRKRTSATVSTIMDDEIRVCTNRTCRRQGSFQTLEIMRDLSPPNVSVNPCGCLGRCGSGPNLAFLPQGIIISHCATPASAARILALHYYHTSSDTHDDSSMHNALGALALRKTAETQIDQANFSQADLLLSQAIQLKPSGGLHIIYKFRSAVRLAMKNYSGALEAAREALNLAPQYTEAYLCEGDAFMAMEQYEAAEHSYSMCLHLDPTIRHSNAFKTRVAKLQEKLVAAHMPQDQQ